MFLLQQNIQMQRKNLKNKVIILWFRISIISLELTRVNPDRNIFSIDVELTSTFLLYRGLVHHHYRSLNISLKQELDLMNCIQTIVF